MPAAPSSLIRSRVRAYLVATLIVVVATLCGLAAAQRASLADEAMLYSLAILIAAHAGRGPGIVAAALSVVAFDFVFVEPRYTLAVADTRFVFTFAVMFVVGAAIGGLVARLRRAEAASRDRERHTAALLAFTRDSAAAADSEAVAAAVVTHVADALGVRVVAHVRDGANLELELERGRVTISLEQQQFVDAVTRQASTAIDTLRLATAARDADVRATTEALRAALLSAVSHDLRTPLGVITGVATALRETAQREQRDGLDTIVNQAERLSRILQNLLAVTRVEAGAVPRREWVPIEELIGAALAHLDAGLLGRQVSCESGTDVLAHIDPVLAELLLVNLVDNAVKHTAAGTPIELIAQRHGTGVVLEVSDRGPGLPSGGERLVFERFFRAAPLGAAGVGLGLAVCRGIAAAHGGTIDAMPRAGGGLTFRVTIPDAEVLPRFDQTPAMAAELR